MSSLVFPTLCLPESTLLVCDMLFFLTALTFDTSDTPQCGCSQFPSLITDTGFSLKICIHCVSEGGQYLGLLKWISLISLGSLD